MISPPVVPDLASVTPVAAFERLFENEFITLERLAISRRAPGGMEYLDEATALAALLDDGMAADSAHDAAPTDPTMHALHASVYRAWPDIDAVVAGRPLELRALLAEDLALPGSTSMMMKRGVVDLGLHLVDARALFGSGQDETLARARAQAEASGMQHVLLVTGDGLVCAAGPTMHETMAHYSNVAFASRVECLRLQEQPAVHR